MIMNTETIETQAVVVREHNEVAQPLSLSEIEQRLDFIKQVMAKRMAEGVDYGKIPGCGDKPGLFQPGAQKLALTFQLAPLVHREVLRELRNDHREYEFTLEIKSAAGRVLGHGVGSCSTLEAKYRYRSGGRKCPECGKEAIFKSKNPGEGFYCWAKKDGCGAKFAANDARIIGQDTGRIEHDNPADFYNTVRKMAFKRALVHGMINATNTSELWSQDLEDLPQAEEAPLSRSAPKPPSEPHQPVKVAQKPNGSTQTGQNTAMVGALKQRIEKLKVSLGPKLDYATAYLKVFTVSGSDQGTSLMPNEDVSDLSETSVDWLAHNWGDFIKRLDAYIEDQGGLGPTVDAPSDQGQAIVQSQGSDPNAPDAPWRSFPVPFGKMAGKKLAEIEKKYLFGFWANFVVETEYQGKPKKPETIAKDTAFREMLNEAGAHYGFVKKD